MAGSDELLAYNHDGGSGVFSVQLPFFSFSRLTFSKHASGLKPDAGRPKT